MHWRSFRKRKVLSERSFASGLLFLTPVIPGKEENIMWGSVWIYVQWCGLAFLWNLNPQLSTQLESVIKGSLTAGFLIRLKPYCPDTLAFIQSYQSTGQKKTRWIVSLQPRWRAHDSTMAVFSLQRCYAVFLNSVQVPRRKTPVNYVGSR